MSRIALGLGQRVQIAEFLKDKVVKTGEGRCIYKEPWDDAAVAHEMGFRCNNGNVASVRKELYGKLHGAGPGQGNTSRVDRLESDMAGHDADIEEMKQAIQDLLLRLQRVEGRLM